MPRTIHLPASVEASLDRLIQSGRFGGQNDVIMCAMAALEDQEAVRDAREKRLVALIEDGIASADRGELTDMDEVFDELRATIEARQGAKDAA